MHAVRILVSILLIAILLSFFWHWFGLIRRLKQIDGPQQLLEFLKQQGRFYNIHFFICGAALVLAVWSHNAGRPHPQPVIYAPVANWEVRIWDQTGAWDIGLGSVEITLLVCCGWALAQRLRVTGQIRLLYALRHKLELDMSEYRIRE